MIFEKLVTKITIKNSHYNNLQMNIFELTHEKFSSEILFKNILVSRNILLL